MTFRVHTNTINQIRKSAALGTLCVGDDKALTEVEVGHVNYQLHLASASLDRADRELQKGRDRFAGKPASDLATAPGLRYEVVITAPDEGPLPQLEFWSADAFKIKLPWLYNLIDFPTFQTLDMQTADARFQLKVIDQSASDLCVDCKPSGKHQTATTVIGGDNICYDCSLFRLGKTEITIDE